MVSGAVGTAGAQATLDGALLQVAQRARHSGLPLSDEVGLTAMVLKGESCYCDVSLLDQGGLRAVVASWLLKPDRLADAEARLSLVVGQPTFRRV